MRFVQDSGHGSKLSVVPTSRYPVLRVLFPKLKMTRLKLIPDIAMYAFTSTTQHATQLEAFYGCGTVRGTSTAVRTTCTCSIPVATPSVSTVGKI